MRKLGLKVWSNNKAYYCDAAKMAEEGVCDFVEIYVIPDSFREYGELWKELNVPVVIHAPHYSHGMNLGEKAKYDFNMKLIEESLKFADILKSNTVIIHPGMEGRKEECVRQIGAAFDNRLIIENKPFYGKNGLKCNGAEIDELKYIIEKSRIGFCLDFGHAICAANAIKKDIWEYLQELMLFNPKMYHLTDGMVDGIIDVHMNYGTGTFPLEKLLEMVPDGSFVTNEAAKKYKDSLRDFIEDSENFRKLDRKAANIKKDVL